MKKKIVSILSVVLFICLICNITYASETNVTLQKNKDKYKGGETVEISVRVNDITLENGIETIIGKISYNKDLYESCTIEEKNNWEADFNVQNGKIILQRNEAINENHIAFVIKLKIKDNVINNDTISFTDINISDENTDLFPQNTTTSITIENIVTDGGKGSEEELQPQNPSQNENTNNSNADKQEANKNNTTDFKEIKEDDTKTENKMPNTGLNSIIGIIAISIILAVVFYVKHNKYKQV